ncbi:MAG: hypothetical protein FJX35_03940 [Alphaproteobacteria bacterium]|nr:hypothetical protein [Alphaproteobacteria bacterium]
MTGFLSPALSVRHRRRRRPSDPERRYDGVIPAGHAAMPGATGKSAAPAAQAAADREAALRFWRHEVRDTITALRLWRSGGDRRRNAVAPAIAELREATLTRRVATAWMRYRQAQRRGRRARGS